MTIVQIPNIGSGSRYNESVMYAVNTEKLNQAAPQVTETGGWGVMLYFDVPKLKVAEEYLTRAEAENRAKDIMSGRAEESEATQMARLRYSWGPTIRHLNEDVAFSDVELFMVSPDAVNGNSVGILLTHRELRFSVIVDLSLEFGFSRPEDSGYWDITIAKVDAPVGKSFLHKDTEGTIEDAITDVVFDMGNYVKDRQMAGHTLVGMIDND